MQKLKQDMNIGHNLQKIRLESRLTQSQVAAKMQLMGCNISRMTYSKIERGVYSIRISELAALSAIFCVDYNRIFEGLNK